MEDDSLEEAFPVPDRLDEPFCDEKLDFDEDPDWVAELDPEDPFFEESRFVRGD